MVTETRKDSDYDVSEKTERFRALMLGAVIIFPQQVSL
jgi:hypothetical protein